jgi:hypothetical protein
MGALRKRWSLRSSGKRTTAGVAAVVAGALFAAGCAPVETGPPPDVTGKWSGRCVNCPVREFSLVVAQKGEQVTGTLQASGRTGLGEDAMTLIGGKIVGRAVTFRTIGRDGVPFDADLRVGADGKTMAGQGRHRAGFDLTFARAGP